MGRAAFFAAMGLIFAGPALGAEAILTLNYSVQCKEGSAFEGMTGSIRVGKKIFRIDLFEARHQLEVLVGPIESTPKIEIDKSADCQLKLFEPNWSWFSPGTEFQDLALTHAPFLVVRKDQYQNRFTDLPLVVTYSVVPLQGGRTELRYTIYLTDEDSNPDTKSTDRHMGNLGRRTDIEWIYDVILDSKHQVVRRRYQGHAWYSSHVTYAFKGQFLPGTQHPVLYNAYSHNVFKDKPNAIQRKKGWVGYSLVPREQVNSAHAHEWVMFRQPWMFKVSDSELKREGRLSHFSPEYLYVMFDGRIIQGAIAAQVSGGDGIRASSGGGQGRIPKLGDSPRQHQTFTAVPLGIERVRRIGEAQGFRGKFRIIQASVVEPVLRINQLRFFRLVENEGNYGTEEITRFFQCRMDGFWTRCEF